MSVKLTDCPDCGVLPGHPHTPGCDVERCSICGYQIIGCDCDKSKHDPLFARWTGIHPGAAEAAYLGIDLYNPGEHKILAALMVKPGPDGAEEPEGGYIHKSDVQALGEALLEGLDCEDLPEDLQKQLLEKLELAW